MKLIKLSTFPILGVILLLSCSQPKDELTQNIGKAQLSATGKEIVLNYYDSTFSSLTIDQAMAMQRTYAAGTPEPTSGYGKTKSIVYSLSQLKNLIWYIEYHARETKLNLNPDSLGVVIYLAQYPSEAEMHQLGFSLSEKLIKDYALRKSIFMVPALKRNGEVIEFDPKKNHFDSQKPGYRDIVPLSKHYPKAGLPFRLTDFEDGSPIADMGNLQPPPPSNN